MHFTTYLYSSFMHEKFDSFLPPFKFTKFPCISLAGMVYYEKQSTKRRKEYLCNTITMTMGFTMQFDIICQQARRVGYRALTLISLMLLALLLTVACHPNDDGAEAATTPPDESTAAVTELEEAPEATPLTTDEVSEPETPPEAEVSPSPETTAIETTTAVETTVVETTTEIETTTAEVTLEETTAAETTTPETDELESEGVLPCIPASPTRFASDCKAIWLSQFDLTSYYLDGNVQRDEASFREKMALILDNVVGDGFNTVVVQVRPYGDSLYPSDYYPPSRLAVGTYGANFAYDPFAIITELARVRGLSVHAWINPMRAMTDAEIRLVDDRFPIKTWYNDHALRKNYLFLHEGRWYLNPAHTAVRHLIAAGVAEILERYDVDGVHMDDYFYPSTDPVIDVLSYAAFLAEGGQSTLPDWRRENLDALVSELYATVKSHDLTTLFGISPSGIINAVYRKQYANVYKWCSEPGYIDYICPQLYFGFKHETADFAGLCEAWQSIVKSDYVTLLIGLSFGKAVTGEDQYAGSGMYEWSEHRDILVRELEHTTSLPLCQGVIVFCYQHLFDLTTGEPLAASQEEHAAFCEALPNVTWRRDGVPD